MERTLEIPLVSGKSLPLSVKAGTPLFVVGPNGSGKSALIQHIVKNQEVENTYRITAHRQNWLESGRIDISASQRENNERNQKAWMSLDDARWLERNAAAKLSSLLFDLVAEDTDHAMRIRSQVGNDDLERASRTYRESPPPFDKLNRLLRMGRLAVSLSSSKGSEILANRLNDETKFDMAQMSDGERSATIIAANVITAESESVLLIDEPERHLHRSVIEPFLSALFTFRKDCIFVIATHEIALPVANSDTQVLMLIPIRSNVVVFALAKLNGFPRKRE